jgi:hypothetical protein
MSVYEISNPYGNYKFGEVHKFHNEEKKPTYNGDELGIYEIVNPVALDFENKFFLGYTYGNLWKKERCSGRRSDKRRIFMKKRSGCFGRTLGILIVIGIIGAAGLGWLGYQKAAEAESGTIPVEDLGIAYIDGKLPQTDTEMIEKFLIGLFGDREIVKDVITALSDDTVAEMITESFYLPDDDTLSTSIAQRILTHRLSKTYSTEELSTIYCGMMGYLPEDLFAAETSSFLTDILDYLTEQGLILNETISDWEKTVQ